MERKYEKMCINVSVCYSMLASVILIMTFSVTSFAADPQGNMSLIVNPKGNKFVDVSDGIGAISSPFSNGEWE